MSVRLSRLRADFRQRRYRRAFRIEPVPIQPLLGFLERLPTPDLPADAPADELDPSVQEQPGNGLDEKILVDAVTNLWRAQRKLGQAAKDESANTRHTRRYLRTCSEMLSDAGLLVQDHDGKAFHPGLSLEVVTFDENPSLTEETVLETVRPSIYLRNRRIQMGQVIVGYPPRQPDSAETQPAEPHSAETQPAEPDSAETQPAEPDSAETQPAEPESAHERNDHE